MVGPVDKDPDLESLIGNNTHDSSTLGFCFHQLFAKAAKAYSQNIAVIFEDTQWTYKKLNEEANRLARYIAEQRSVGPHDIVGVALDRSIDLIVSILAILKLGAAYVPIDPTFPADRIQHMVTNSSPKLIITSEETCAALESWRETCLIVGNARESIGRLSSDDLSPPNIEPSDLAYIIYTSGSTGKPKGVEANHEALCNLLFLFQRTPGCQPEDNLLAVSTISFDISILDVLMPLVSGATLVMAPTTALRDPSAVLELMRRHSITMMQATPSFWQMLIDGGWKGQHRLKRILTAGEPISIRLRNRLLESSDAVWNGYGPTESAICATLVEMKAEDEEITIGDPIPNFHVYVLDPESLSPVLVGSLGELFVGGVGVNRGYHKNIEMTRSKFFEINPFHKGRLYRTGDLARFIAPGKLTLVGRSDHQVKVRGYRIELDDVSNAITEHPEVATAVVVSRDDQLIAYYTRVYQAVSTERDDERIDSPLLEVRDNAHDKHDPPLSSVLGRWLNERRPAYMVPAFFIELDALPMTLNGKVDRKALPDHKKRALQEEPAGQSAVHLEVVVTKAWKMVLEHANFDVNDSFFQVGGNSLRAVRLQQALENATRTTIPMVKLFEHYSIKAQAAYFAEHADHPAPSKEKTHTTLVTDGTDDRIAIVSMACRLPGGVETPADLWQLLETGTDVITDVPRCRWNADAIYDADPTTPGKSYCRRGGFVRPDVRSFDASLFGVAPREAMTLDPAQHMMLETSWEAFERAGYTMDAIHGSQTGVYVGIASASTLDSCTQPSDSLNGYGTTGSSSAAISGRVSYFLGLEGPSVTLDTACSASLVSTHMACTALRQGECNMAIAGGVSVLTSSGLHIDFSRLGGLSSDGLCRAFSADTSGTGFSEGCAVVLLKRLADAQRDGDTIHAVIRGSSINHTGRQSAAMSIPSASAQERLIRTALGASRLDPDEIDYIEAHGTATKLGDPIEGAALAEVFGGRPVHGRPLLVGSVKSHIGHTQAAAGMAGLLKVVLSMEHERIPQTLHVSEPTPLVEWKKYKMELAVVSQEWPVSERRRRAGVSSFGLSGTNAHVIVEEAPQRLAKKTKAVDARVRSSDRILLLSARTKSALQAQAMKLHSYILHAEAKDCDDFFDDLCFSLATSRNHFRYRLAIQARNKEDLLEQLGSKLESLGVEGGKSMHVVSERAAGQQEPRLAMLFTGQGSQLPEMGRELHSTYPVFRAAFHEILGLFVDFEKPLLQAIWAEPQSPSAALLRRTDYAQCAIFALEVALFRLLQSWGIKADALLGHSIGEIAAIHVAGVLSLEDACRMVAARGRLMEESMADMQGTMASIEASVPEIEKVIHALDVELDVDIACHNAPMQTVVSGDEEAVDQLTHHFHNKLHRRSKELDVSQAFHSSHVDSMLHEYRAVLTTLQFQSPELTVISSVTGKKAGKELLSPDYWVRQARDAVLFNEGIQTLHDLGIDTFLELGAQSLLLGPAAASLADVSDDPDKYVLIPTLTTGGQSDVANIQTALAKLYVRQICIDWSTYYEPFQCSRIELPTYAFQRESFSLAGDAASCSVTVVRQDPGLLDFVKPSPDHATLPVQSEFCISWDQFRADGDRKGRFGILGDTAAVSSWTQTAKRAMQASGSEFVDLDNLENAHDLDGILCFAEASASDVPSQCLDGVTEALHIVQKAASINFNLPIMWIVPTADLAAGSEQGEDLDAVCATRGPLRGLLRTAKSEHPELRLRIVALNVQDPSPDLLNAALMTDEPESIITQDRLLVPRLEVAKPLEHSSTPIIRKDGAVIVTGGLGGIGRNIALWLATEHDITDIVITSRKGLKDLNAQSAVDELRKVGATAIVVACDVANPATLKRVLTMFDERRPLRGVIHAAGVADNGVFSSMTRERCATVFTPKVNGAWNLHQLTKDMDLDQFVMLSSISGAFGLPGLGNYAAANTFLDSLAEIRRSQGLPATSIAYGVWQGVGMASEITQKSSRSSLAEYGLQSLTVGEGLRLLNAAMCSSRALTVGVTIDLNQLRASMETSGGFPPLYRSLVPKNTQPEPPSDGRTDNDEDLLVVLQKVDHKKRTAIMLDAVLSTVTRALGHRSADDIDVDASLQSIGFDSLTAVMMRNRLAKLTGLKSLTVSNITWDHPSLRALSRYLLEQLDLSEVRDGSKDVKEAVPSTQPIQPRGSVMNGSLDASITFDNAGQLPPETAVFLTGATGFVGAFVLQQLLSSDVHVFCLVRAENEGAGLERLTGVLSDYDMWEAKYASIITVVPGDMSQQFFGLTEEDFSVLAQRVNKICHASALVDWMRPLSEYMGPNVTSTHEILRLASRGCAKDIHVISTIATLAKHLGYDVPESSAEHGYLTSKYMAEQMTTAARWRGAEASIYRIPFVTAAASTGCFRRDQGDFLHNLIAGSLELGAFPSLPGADLAVVQPVDYLARTVVDLMLGRTRLGQDFDFANHKPQNCDQFFARILSAAGREAELESFKTWHPRALKYAAAHSKSPLARITAVLDMLKSEQDASDMLKALPGGKHILGGADHPAPELDEAFVGKYYKRIVESARKDEARIQ